MEPLLYLTYIAVILLIGILCTLIAHVLKIPNILLLLTVGIVVNKLKYEGQPLIAFPGVFLTSMAILALVMIVFDSSSRFKFKEFDTFSARALKLTAIFLTLNLLLMSLSTFYIFNISSILIVILFAALMTGTSPDAVLTMFRESKNRVAKMLEIESIINTPFMVLIPFIVIDIIQSTRNVFDIAETSVLIHQLSSFLQQFVSGIGAGIVIGIVVLKIMRKKYSITLSPLAIITAALLTYTLAENLGGNGVLAVTVMGVIFGSFYVKEKFFLHEISTVFANALEILVFVLIGLLIDFPIEKTFLIKSAVLFLLFIIIRFFAVMLSFTNTDFTLKEKIFMSLNVEKGIAVAVVAFSLSTLYLEQSSVLFQSADLVTILHLTLAFLLYSIVLSTLLVKISRFFIGVEVKQGEK